MLVRFSGASRRRLSLLILSCAVAACGSSTSGGVSGPASGQAAGAAPVPVAGQATRTVLRIDFGTTSRLMLEADTGLSFAAGFTVQVYLPSGELLRELAHQQRTPGSTRQDVTIAGLPDGNLMMRVLFFDASGGMLGYQDQSFSLSQSATVTVDSLTPGVPPAMGTASPSPAASPIEAPPVVDPPVVGPPVVGPPVVAPPVETPAPSPAAPDVSPPPASSPSPVNLLSVQPAQVSLSPLATQALQLSDSSQDVTGAASWTSSQPTVAAVSSSGVVTATGAGSAQITATLAGRSAQATVTVSGPTLQSLSVSPSFFSLTVPATAQFAALGQYSDGTSRDLSSVVTWSSSATLSVSSAGLVTAVTGGDSSVGAILGSMASQVQGTTSPQVVPPFQPPPAPIPAPAAPVTVNTLTMPETATSTKTMVPNIPTPAGTLRTTFTGYSNNYQYAIYPFKVAVTGAYSFQSNTDLVTNTSWLLTGLFSPSASPVQPSTSIGDFFAGMFAGSTAPYDSNLASIALTQGTQYTLLVAFNTGSNSAVSTVNVTGPGGVGVIYP